MRFYAYSRNFTFFRQRFGDGSLVHLEVHLWLQYWCEVHASRGELLPYSRHSSSINDCHKEDSLLKRKKNNDMTLKFQASRKLGQRDREILVHRQ